jgi:hypothetical protein
MLSFSTGKTPPDLLRVPWAVASRSSPASARTPYKRLRRRATALLRRTIDTIGRDDDTAVTAFTDGCPALRPVLGHAGVTKPPILDWFHIAMRLQHTRLAAASLSTDDPGRVTAKATIVAEVERLHWRIWNGNATNVRRSINRIRKVMHVFRGETSHRTKGMPSRKLWHARHEVDKYLGGQCARLVNYARMISCWSACRDVGHRRHRELPRQSADEQISYVDGPLLARYFAVF